MVKNLFASLVFLGCVYSLSAQVPMKIHVIPETPSLGLRAACLNDAGTIRIQDGAGNLLSDDRIFLPFGDSLSITHQGDADLGGDPNPATLPGIFYIFYTCPPSVSGPTQQAIAQDSCVEDRDTILVNNIPRILQDSFWASSNGNRQGNIVFLNNGLIQNSFNAGAPVEYWFAPATIDDFNSRRYELDSTGTAGNCVNVRTDQAFSVVYLNEITIADISTNLDGLGCTGSFSIRGGLPEFDPAARYTIAITKTDEPTVTGNLRNAGAISHTDTVQFYIPEAGAYTITVSDNAGSTTSFAVDMQGCQTVDFTLPFLNALPGDTVCLPLEIAGFNGIGFMEFDITWDPAVLDLIRTENFNSDVTLLSPANLIESATNDRLNFSWADDPTNPSGVTVPDGSTLFTLCFRVVGTLGTTSPVSIVENTDPNETIGTQSVPEQRFGYRFNSGRVNVAAGALFAAIESKDLTCNVNNSGPGPDGSITVTLAQGLPPYSVQWEDLTRGGGLQGPVVINQAGGVFDSLAGNLLPGNYRLLITDSEATPNTIDTTLTIGQPALIEGRIDVIKDPTCSYSTNGALRARVQPANPNYVYSWDASSVNSNVLENVGGGNYSVTVTNENGCFEVFTTTLLVDEIIVGAAVTDATCSGFPSGSISVFASGGNDDSGVYNFNWEGFSETTDTSTRNDLVDGFYRVTITDDSLCVAIDSFVVGAVKTLGVNPTITDVSCNGLANGIIQVGATATGGTEARPYNFSWTGPGALTPNNTDVISTITGLAAGDYSLNLSDQDGCSITTSFTVNEPDSLQITTSVTNETCEFRNDGTITAEVTGGTAPYLINWSDGQTGVTATNLVSGMYELTVTDNRGCIDSTSATVFAPAGPTVTALPSDFLECSADTDGSLSVSATPLAGTTILSYSWSNDQTGSSISGLSPGVYTVTITADDQCITVDSGLVNAPAPLSIDSLVGESPSCPDFSNGRLAVFASGGTTPYRYVWEDTGLPDTTFFSVRPGLAAGAYDVTIVDANDCPEVVGTASVVDPVRLRATFADTTSVNCFDGDCDGQARVLVDYEDGSTGRFGIEWESGEATLGVAEFLATNLCAQWNTVTVVDSNNCSLTDSVFIPSPPEIVVELTAEDISCNGAADGSASVSVSGGTPDYMFNWAAAGSDQPAITGLEAGDYAVIITDANGCIKSESISVTEPIALQLSIDDTRTQDPLCNGATDGILAVRVNEQDSINPLAAQPYSWSGGVAAGDADQAQDLAAGTYSVTVTDINGCQDSLTYTLTEPSQVVAIIPNPTPPPCFGDATFLMVDTAFGGNGAGLSDYTYSVDNSGINFPLDQVTTIFAGTHVITVEDPFGCTYTDSLVILQPDPLTVAFDPGIVTVELGDTATQLRPDISSSLPIDSFIWSPADYLSSPGVQNPIVIPLETTEYQLTVVDINGCTARGTVLVELDRSRNVYIPNVFSPNGDGFNDELRVFACKGVTRINSAQVFDRWGDLIYERRDILPDCAGGAVLWDGRWNNQDANPGVYVYVIEIEFLDEVTLTYRGDISVLR